MVELYMYGTLTHLGGKFVLFLHGSIHSDVGASTNPGALHFVTVVYSYLHKLITDTTMHVSKPSINIGIKRNFLVFEPFFRFKIKNPTIAAQQIWR